jgi:hypothetical protein
VGVGVVPCALGRPWVSVRPLTGSATVSWLDGDRRAARKRRAQGPFRGSAKSPEERTRVLRRRDGTSRGVAVCLCFPAIREISRGCYQGAPFGVPPPSLLSRARSPETPTHVKRFAGSDDARPGKGARHDFETQAASQAVRWRCRMSVVRRAMAEVRRRATRSASYAGLTRLRGRSPFDAAKARVSIHLRKSILRRGWMAGSSPAMTQGDVTPRRSRDRL